MNELAKTSFLIIATIFTAAGAALLPTKIIAGTFLLLVAVIILALRGYLKKKGLIETIETKVE